MSNTLFELVARLLPAEGYPRYVARTTLNGVRWSAYSVNEDPVYGWIWNPGFASPSIPFPFGEDVVPD